MADVFTSLSRIPIVLDDSTQLSIINAELTALKQQVSILVNSIALRNIESHRHLQTRSSPTQGSMTPPLATSETIPNLLVSHCGAVKLTVLRKLLQSQKKSHHSSFVNEVDEDGFQRDVIGRRSKIGCRPRTDSISFHGVKKKAVKQQVDLTKAHLLKL